MKQLLEDSYGFIFEDELIQEISKVGVLKNIPKGTILMDVGSTIKSMPLLISGAIKVMREDHDGDEILLYFLERGDTCAMTMTCCLGDARSEIRAVAEQDTELVMIPVQKMSQWVQKYQSWMSFVFQSYNTRMMEMLGSIDSLAFLDTHGRLQKYLSDKVKVVGHTLLETTHQEIAYDLHTSRVVVSRLLKQLEKTGQIKLHRNRIEVFDF